MSQHFIPASDLGFTGRFTSLQTAPGMFQEPEPDAGARVAGWARHERTGQPASLIVIADDRDVVRGLARSTPRPAKPGRGTPPHTHEPGHWYGFTQVTGARPLRAYAVQEGTRHVQRLPGVHFAGDLRGHPSALSAEAWDRTGAWHGDPRADAGGFLAAGYVLSSRGANPVTTGQLLSFPVQVAAGSHLVIPYTTGSTTAALSLQVMASDSDQPLVVCDLTEPAVTWATWVVELPRLAPSSIRIAVADADTTPNGWIAVGEPRLVGLPAP